MPKPMNDLTRRRVDYLITALKNEDIHTVRLASLILLEIDESHELFDTLTEYCHHTPGERPNSFIPRFRVALLKSLKTFSKDNPHA